MSGRPLAGRHLNTTNNATELSSSNTTFAIRTPHRIPHLYITTPWCLLCHFGCLRGMQCQAAPVSWDSSNMAGLGLASIPDSCHIFGFSFSICSL